MNKYNIGNKLYYYKREDNKIIDMLVFAITKKDETSEIKYNYLFSESECFTDYYECFKYARHILKAEMEDKLEDLERK